jgi:hypothetical protein
MDSAQDLFQPVPTPAEFQAPIGDRFFISPDGTRAMLSSEEGVQVRFFEYSVKLELASKEAGVPLYKNVTMVEIRCKYDPQNIHVHPVRDVEEDEWKVRFKHEWQLYLKTKEHAAQGYAVMNWDEIQPNQKATLVALGILTLEQLLVAEDDVLKKIFDKPKEIKESALAQLNYKNKVADISEVTKKLMETKGSLETAEETIMRLNAEKASLQMALNVVKGKNQTAGNTPVGRFLKRSGVSEMKPEDVKVEEVKLEDKKEGEI